MEDVTRRAFLGSAAAGMTALAGCSNNGDNSDTPDQGTPSQDDKETSNSDSDSTEPGTSTEDSGQVSGKLKDTVHTGEEELENFLSEGDVLPDYQWIEFENPQDQINSPVESDLGEDSQFKYLLENGSYRLSQAGSDYEIDGMYLTRVPDATGEEALAVFAFNEELWDEEDDFVVNFRDTVYGLREIGSTEDLETLLSEDVQAYNDVSEDFPQEYLDLVEE